MGVRWVARNDTLRWNDLRSLLHFPPVHLSWSTGSDSLITPLVETSKRFQLCLTFLNPYTSRHADASSPYNLEVLPGLEVAIELLINDKEIIPETAPKATQNSIVPVLEALYKGKTDFLIVNRMLPHDNPNNIIKHNFLTSQQRKIDRITRCGNIKSMEFYQIITDK